MDSDQIISRIEMQTEHLNQQRKPGDWLSGAAYMGEFIIGVICALEAAEEKEVEDEMKLEAMLEQQEEFE
jgi:hypothetical protein